MLARKLGGFVGLDAADRAALERICTRARRFAGQTDLLRQGEVPDAAIVVLRGFVCRARHRPNGSCQILAYLLPGDICDPDFAVPRPMDHVLATLTASLVARVPREAFLSLIDRHPNVARALRIARVVDEAVAREWLVSIGRRSARERLAHLFCELAERLGAVGLSDGDGYELPLTQVALSDTLALTSVHVNRTLREMRREGLIELRGRRLEILDAERLKGIAEFDAAYLRAPEPTVRWDEGG
ncbi:Crp/Fnr family transcriptional regulator [Methylobacterium radiodurans]|uniref:Crp/Fnr family transcriptional regulator n=2 Tax=Methylobacterium radiodurans TaxID=2202828 RepID=A0A2U8VYB6_9HYPH|nr:Crp/Fnr family transcriptional regulator [Methylobacterium radiodurans]